MSKPTCCDLAIFALTILMTFVPAVTWAQDVAHVPLDLASFISEDGNLYLGQAVVDFDAGQALPGILDVRLHLTGSYCCHLVVGGQFPGPVTGGQCYDPGLTFGFLLEDQEVFPTRHTIAADYDNTPSFATCVEHVLDTEIAFDSAAGPPDWSFLATGTGTVYLAGLENPEFCVYPIYCYNQHSLVVTAAELIVEVTGVPVEKTSWGVLKAIYR